MLFLGCPVLEEIKLFCCQLHVSRVSSEVLNSLVLDCCYLEKKLVISTPYLLHLDIHHTETDGLGFSLENMASLVDASVQCLNVYVHDDLGSPNGGLNFQNCSSKLNMPDHILERSQVMGKEVSYCPNFKNLKSLQLGCWDLRNTFNSITTFLYNSPNLKKLTLRVCPNPNCSSSKQKSCEQEWRDAKSSYEKLRDALLQQEHLQVIEIINSAELREEIVNKLVEELAPLAKATRKC
ncbi:hypothetical protein LUZ63_014764 [Rhynchospora breviuscula]|uniref:Uncharacterized protein n=1 Tax=Rhynchospora breviuscula TaxID=2022672 RepID=A0A9Q0CAZ5_9POAL|nr:hypothetical protein LUZ63_014764 [Rhynchospora breviuscula]